MKVKRDPQLSKDFGETLRELRNEQKLSQEYVANMLGTSQSQVGRLERGETNPTLATMGAIFDVLGISLRELLRLRNNNKESCT
ncbi:helix-turn-helix domain-containing protein [Mucilaginibacter sp. FT3.2]|uniref:helix-turn-helix domain-containing protein n=1 Tax=Mucilaginibacter sp. FT3.2 TaxID=2723090 RepID=UPI00161851B8|nr:transcriptional regulator with XRE-family HTH domain [Mucilaginibacter sp. FT3.2]